jgi:hypothetical protein
MIKLNVTKIKIIIFTLFPMTLASCGRQHSDNDPRKLKTSSALEPGESSNWIQGGAVGGFTILERSVEGSDGCNSFYLAEFDDGYFIFAPGGKIIQNATFMSNEMDCSSQGLTRSSLSSFPWEGWKSWELSGGELMITTENGETHRFSRDRQKH